MFTNFSIFVHAIRACSVNAILAVTHTVHNSHTANSKWVGACISMGNFSPSTSWMANGNFDPDFSDQDQIANPSMPISGQV